MLQTKLKVVDNFVDVKAISKHFRGEVWSFGWQSNANVKETPFWHIHFCGSRRPDEFFRQDEFLAGSQALAAIGSVWEQIKTQFAPDYYLVRCYANGHTFGLDGHVHRDAKPGEDALTALVYVNATWKAEWAGETIFIDDDDNCEAVLPKAGRLVVFDGAVRHVARSPSRDCPALRMTLVFKLKRHNPAIIGSGEAPSEEFVTFLRRRGTTSTSHSGRTLFEHLLGTWRLLQSWGCEEQTCLAGLFHSIYGTSVYRHRSVDRKDRNIVRSLIGEPAEELAFVFGVLDRPNAWAAALATGRAPLHGLTDAVLALDSRMLDRLLEVEVANLIEQGEASSALDSLVDAGLLARPGVCLAAKKAISEAIFSLTTVGAG